MPASGITVQEEVGLPWERPRLNEVERGFALMRALCLSAALRASLEFPVGVAHLLHTKRPGERSDQRADQSNLQG